MDITIEDGKIVKMNTLFVEYVEKSWDFNTFAKFVFVYHVNRKKNVMKGTQVLGW